MNTISRRAALRGSAAFAALIGTGDAAMAAPPSDEGLVRLSDELRWLYAEQRRLELLEPPSFSDALDHRLDKVLEMISGTPARTVLGMKAKSLALKEVIDFSGSQYFGAPDPDDLITMSLLQDMHRIF